MSRKPDVRVHRVDLGLDQLAMQPEQVAHLTSRQREQRVRLLVEEAHHVLDQAYAQLVEPDGRKVAGTVLLFSGGNDSTVAGHLMRGRCTHAGHANTGIGIEATRQYVRDTCAAWGLPLLERRAPHDRDQYRAHVLAHGFPGSGLHPRVYQRLKGRAIELMQAELVNAAGGGHRARVVFVAGRRRTESAKRTKVPELERKRSAVWASPMVNWTKLDMNTYRLMHRLLDPVPTNPVADLLHMSGECLCGCYAKLGERELLIELYPDAMAEVVELEAAIADRLDIPWYAKTWGWSYDQAKVDASRVKSRRRRKVEPPAGYLCGDCAPPTPTITRSTA